jgi:hypothetical protein
VLFLPYRASSTDNGNIKWALQTYGGVYVALYLDTSSSYYNPTTAAYYYSGSTQPNHAATIVGWDDSYAASNFAKAPPGPGAFVVKNSWGTSWGKSGYFYVSYYDTQFATNYQPPAVFTSEPTTNYDTNYQYDPLGWVTSVGSDGGGNTAWGANVFTATSNQQLSAVSFYAGSVNTQYAIYVYTDPTSGPIGGTGYTGPAGTITMPGYHTIPLTTSVPLTAGHKFSVAIKITAPGNNQPIPVESTLQGYSSATAQPGQSYLSATGTSWTDATQIDPTMNICIKAFTTPWASLGGQIPAGTSPAASSWGSGRLDLFVQGMDGALYHKSYSGSTWSGWENLGGKLTSSPAATSPGNGQIDVFVRGTNGALYEKTTTNGGATWSNWASLGGQIPAGTSPAASSWGSGRLDLFVQGMDGALYHKSYSGSTWSGWENLGGKLTSSPAATSPGTGAIDVFVRGTNGALYQRSWTGSWSSWAPLGGQIPAGTSPAASSWGSGHLDLFVQGMNGALYHKSYSGSTWSAWENLGGKLTSSPAATSPGNGQINVFVRGTNGALYQRSWTGSWSSWTSLGGQIPAGTAPAASSWGSGHLDLFVQGMDGALYHMSATGSTWSSWENLGGYLTSSPAATSPASGVIDVFVCGTDGALWQGT